MDNINNITRKNYLDDIGRWRTMYKGRVDNGHPDCQALSRLLDDFWKFCDAYTDYTDEKLGELAKASGSREDHVRYYVDSVLLDEWTQIVRVLEQRELQRYHTYLHTVDKQSRDYLPAAAPPMISYLGRANVIRQHVYSAISIASIPREQYPNGDGMALPHEAGHHIWHLMTGNDGFDEMIARAVKSATGNSPVGRKIDTLLQHWLQEIYADVYGAYVTKSQGTDHAFSLIDMLERRIGDADDLFVDDGQHAFVYLRPLIRAKALSSRDLQDEITARWMDVVQNKIGMDIKPESILTLQDGSNNVELPLDDLDRALERIIDETILPQIDSLSEQMDFSAEVFTFNPYRLHVEARLNVKGGQRLESILPTLSLTRLLGPGHLRVRQPHTHFPVYIPKQNERDNQNKQGGKNERDNQNKQGGQNERDNQNKQGGQGKQGGQKKKDNQNKQGGQGKQGGQKRQGNQNTTKTKKKTNIQPFTFNGIDGATGAYALPPMTGGELSAFIVGAGKPENLAELRFRHRQASQAFMGVKEGVDPKDLGQAGWGVIFAHGADPAIKEALTPLLDLRRAQAGEHFYCYEGPGAYRPGESKSKFLARHGAGPGPADPAKVPYYLLIVGDPGTIPYRFQSQLDVQYAVGRIHFDTPAEYANYARSVVRAETGETPRARRAAFFGVANPDDPATQMSANQLVRPLYEYVQQDQPDWTLSAHLGDGTGKAKLARLLGGPETPAFLFTASHGMAFPLDDPRQLPHQGALLCQDWPGPNQWRGKGAIPQDFYLAGDDLAGDADLSGLIAFFFACYGAGTPRLDEFARQAFKDRQAIAPHPFLARLPTQMLNRPKGGALAVVGHVERAWSYSFNWPGADAQTTVFESAIKRLLEGHPVGSAFEFFNERYAELATVLSDELEEISFDRQYDPYELAGLWTANNDARGYAIIGDPAVRLPA